MSVATRSIDDRRLRATFEALTTDGKTGEGGLNRPALSSAHLKARATFTELIAKEGFAKRTDGAGNLSAQWEAAGATASTLLLGSHLDSVPNGGRFDGALGVAAAFEVMQSLRDTGIAPRVNVEVIDFTDEEGTWVSLMGSRAFTGQLSAHDLDHPHGPPGAFDRALTRAALTREGILSAVRTDTSLRAFLELHIEQGPRLETRQTDIGIVSAMVGIFKYVVTFTGLANHAGTTPMDRRRDAAQGAAGFVLQVRQTVMREFPKCVANVGHLTLAPGAYNIVPETAACALELRAATESRAQELEAALRAAASEVAAQHNLKADFTFVQSVSPRAMDPALQSIFKSAADGLGLTSCSLLSLAGHDAQNMAARCPAGLIFVPSRDGVSHSSREFTRWEDCVSGCQTLFEAARRLVAHP